MSGIRPALLGVLVLLAAAGAEAHTRSLSYAHWQLGDDGGEARARVSHLDLSRLALDPRTTPDYDARVAAQVAADLQLWSAAGPCQPEHVRGRSGDDGWIQVQWSSRCDGPPTAVRTRLLEAVAPAHLHLVSVASENGTQVQRALGFADPVLPVSGNVPAPAAGLVSYLKVGVGHILSGADHLVFVLLLLMLATGLREVIVLASTFTLAHSLTLVAASLGWVQVHSGWVEALIGLSIVLVAAEHLWARAGRDPGVPWLLLAALGVSGVALWPRLPLAMLAGLLMFTACYFALLRRSARPLRLRLLLVFGFGLVHGLGFAGEMLDLSVPRSLLLTALFGFNLGVELGQLAVIALLWPLLAGVARWPRAEEGLRHALGLAALMVGSFWWVSRLSG